VSACVFVQAAHVHKVRNQTHLQQQQQHIKQQAPNMASTARAPAMANCVAFECVRVCVYMPVTN